MFLSYSSSSFLKDILEAQECIENVKDECCLMTSREFKAKASYCFFLPFIFRKVSVLLMSKVSINRRVIISLSKFIGAINSLVICSTLPVEAKVPWLLHNGKAILSEARGLRKCSHGHTSHDRDVS
jgi:hypothetical protein